MSFIQKVKILKQNYCNGDFVILSFSPIGESNPQLRLSDYFTASLKGNINYLSVNKEYTMELEEISNNPKWGSTYKIISIPSLTSLDLDTLTLEQSKEILLDVTTESQSDNILDAYPNFIKLVLTEGKESIDVKKIHNVGEYRLNAYCRILTDKYKYLHILQEYKQYDIDITDCKALFDSFHDDPTIMKEFDERPYRTLIKCLGRSFYKTDRLLMDIREELSDSYERCEFMILDILDRNEQDCSSKLNAQTLFTVASEDYNSPQLLPLLKVVAQESDLIYYKEDTNELAKMSTYNGECLIANFIKEKVKNPNKVDFEWDKFKEIKDGTLTEEQSNVLHQLCEYDIVLLDALAGGGKSSSMMAVIQMLEHYHKTYTCVTATGKASARLSEQTGRPSSTIHKATMNGNISTDYLIVDEDSFLSIELMCMIINAIDNSNIKLLLLGDVEQLPSISCGRIIRDCIESGRVPICTLTKCFRFSQGGMSMVSTKARDGEFYLTEEECQLDHVVLGKNKDYEYIKSDGTIEQICDTYQSLLDKKIKPNDICVIIPQNVGNMGVFKVNNALQQIANPPKPNEKVITNKVYSSNKSYDMSFKVGDLVMNTKNNYHMMNEEEYEQMKTDELLCKEDVATCSVFNGQIGKILSISDDNIFKILFDQEILVFDKKDSYNLILAYASNPFRMQGSQCEYIIAITLEQHKRMLNRQLLYTTLTRASKGIIEIGEINAMKYAVATMGDDNRKTWLKELLLDD